MSEIISQFQKTLLSFFPLKNIQFLISEISKRCFTELPSLSPKFQTLSDVLSKNIWHSSQKARHNLFYGNSWWSLSVFSHNWIILKDRAIKGYDLNKIVLISQMMKIGREKKLSKISLQKIVNKIRKEYFLTKKTSIISFWSISQENGQIRQICRKSLPKNPTSEFENPTTSAKIGTLGSPDALNNNI